MPAIGKGSVVLDRSSCGDFRWKRVLCELKAFWNCEITTNFIKALTFTQLRGGWGIVYHSPSLRMLSDRVIKYNIHQVRDASNPSAIEYDRY